MNFDPIFMYYASQIYSYLKFHYNVEKFVYDFSYQGKILSKWKPMIKLFCQ